MRSSGACQDTCVPPDVTVTEVIAITVAAGARASEREARALAQVRFALRCSSLALRDPDQPPEAWQSLTPAPDQVSVTFSPDRMASVLAFSVSVGSTGSVGSLDLPVSLDVRIDWESGRRSSPSSTPALHVRELRIGRSSARVRHCPRAPCPDRPGREPAFRRLATVCVGGVPAQLRPGSIGEARSLRPRT